MTDSDPLENSPDEGGDESHAAHASEALANIEPMRVVEAVLFASDAPLTPARIASIVGVGDARDMKKHIAALNEQYAAQGLSFRIEEIAGGFRMLTLPAYNTWLTKLLRARDETKLSQAAMETLAIVAYKQPVTRADVEAIRGVAAGDMLNRLREMNLVKIVGRAEDLGRPLLYGTTRNFLEVFGLGALEDLPQVEVLRSGSSQVAAAAATEPAAPPAESTDQPPALRIASEE
ncbi:MAG TPA: SMC-Scp complex subunit ScpB [Phycisphaerae bacterium]|nr:SMC-Scp complex subunit ScpB [Phycisphaerae bacterium]